MRKLFFILISIIIIICGFSFLAYVYSAPILAKIISHKTETPVTIRHVDFKKEVFIISDLQIENPKGAKLSTALKVKTITIQTPYKRYIKDPIVIEQIQVDDVYVNIQLYKKDQTEGNWQTIMKTMEKEHKSPLSIERVTMIKKLILTNIKIDLILSDGSRHTLSPIDRLEFDNLHSDKGVPIQEISEIIIEQMMNSVFIIKGFKAIIETPIEIFKGIFPFL